MCMNRVLYNFKMSYNGKTFEINNYNSKKHFYTIEYSVEKNSKDKMCQSSFTISNLPDNVRSWFAKDESDNITIKVDFSIGNSCDKNITQIFVGKAITIKSSGFLTINTEIVAYSLSDMQIYASLNLKKNSTINDLKTLFASKLGLTLNNQANDGTEILTQDYNIITRDVFATAKERFAKQIVIIDDDKLIFMTNDKQLSSSASLNRNIFTESNGLLECPTKSGSIVEVRTFLRPNIAISNQVIVAAKTQL